MTNVIELRAFRERAAQAPCAPASPSAGPDGRRATPFEAAFLPFTLWRGAAACWLSLWVAPLGFRGEALDWPNRLPTAVFPPQDHQRPAAQRGPVGRR